MTIYRGIKYQHEPGFGVVTKDYEVMDRGPSQRLFKHSPNGFNWGYGGSGPAQLALALLLDATGDQNLSLMYHQRFKWQVVAAWQGDWHISDEAIRLWIARQMRLDND